ncbi:C-type lectin 37Db-like isoform X1 [Bactrocera neohumeralis]|uniref:C-type lectin 37Db-like isoform X1 n=1 Tax=Bactrocera neohumeralis TaxID=98809 RepID=UPI0021652BFF|nr:C-type lectin 37Db-like isoform X1 [Bactrocera neohumeralis]
MVNLLHIIFIFLNIYGVFAVGSPPNNDVLSENAENMFPFIKIGSKYYFINESLKMNWFSSSYYCRSYGGELANIESDAEFLALQNYILARKIESRLWFDGNDLAKEGKFDSHTTGRPLIFTKWSPGNPNNWNNEDCLDLYLYNKILLMNDNNCDAELLAICQYREPNRHCSGKNSLMHQNDNCILSGLVEAFAQTARSCKSCSQPLLCPTS